MLSMKRVGPESAGSGEGGTSSQAPPRLGQSSPQGPDHIGFTRLSRAGGVLRLSCSGLDDTPYNPVPVFTPCDAHPLVLTSTKPYRLPLHQLGDATTVQSGRPSPKMWAMR